MKNIQLKTGNKVLHNGTIRTIDGIVRGHVCLVEDVTETFGKEVYGPWVDLDEIEFIRLNPVSLSKCNLTGFPLEILGSYARGYHVVIESKWVKIEYLHQLQNLYFAIEYQELKIDV
ncbi:hypothetical protein D3C85_1471170 [compost metagenome]